MKTDRELLELAAKAAGLTGVWVDRLADDGHRVSSFGIGKASWSVAPLWNPLTNDGDALRLAVSLLMNIEVTDTDVYACAQGNFSEPAKPDAFAATRRAIFRAAAEIGRAMP